MSRSSLLFILLLLSLSACIRVKREAAESHFSIAALVREQVIKLSAAGAQLSKTALAGADTATAGITPDSSGWADEFKLIADTDIDKPALIGRYDEKQTDDPHSNLTVSRYETLDNDLEVQSMAIYFLNDPENIKRIEITGRRKTILFRSSLKVVMQFDNIDGELLLEEYEIQGDQKMLWQDPLQYRVSGRIF